MKDLSKKILEIKPSETIRVSNKLNEFKDKGFETIDFGVGEPDFKLFDNIKNKGINAIKEDKNKYSNVSGLLSLKKEIINKLKRDNLLDYNENEILISNGAKHSLYNAIFALSNPGDEFIIIKPYWVSYIDQIKLCDAVPIFVDSYNLEVKADLIEEKISNKTKAIIINSPSNPSGKIIPKDELLKIANLAIKHDLYIISDEVYEYFSYDNSFISIASLNDEIKKRTITINSCSKSYGMTGLRVGYIAASKDIIKLINSFQGHITSNVSNISQEMAIEALKLTKNDLNEIINDFKEKRDYVINELNKLNINYSIPNGAFYFFIPINKTNLNSIDFAEKLLIEEKVAVVPGIAFGMENYIRLSYSLDKDSLIKGMEKFISFFKKNSC
jgi:aspartate aminotransferase